MKDVLIGIHLMFYATSALALGMPDGTVIHDDEACYTIFSGAWGHGKKLGATWQTIAHAQRDGRNVLDIVVHQRVGNGDFDMRDHLVLDAGTLLPVRLESMRDGNPHAELDYTPGRVTGWHVAKDGSRLTTDVRLPGPVWDGDLYGPTFAALKLAAGARFTVPFYQYDRGLGEFRGTVTGIERVMTPYGAEEAWVVHAGPSSREMLDYLIGRDNRREVGYRGKEGYQILGGDCTGLE